MTNDQREELYERLVLIKEKWLSVSDDSKTQMISSTFNHEFISFITVIVPRVMADLTKNSMITLKPESKELLKVYGHLIFCEIEHFLKSIGYIDELINNTNENKQNNNQNDKPKHLPIKSKANSNISVEPHQENNQINNLKQDDLNSNDGSIDSSSSASLMDIMNNQLDDGYTSPLEVNPNFTGKINDSIMDEIIKPKIQPQPVIQSKQYSIFYNG